MGGLIMLGLLVVTGAGLLVGLLPDWDHSGKP